MTEIQPPYRPPTEVGPSIFLVPVPIPIPLRYVNCYLLQGASGWTLIDAGFHDSLAREAWRRAFAELSVRPQDVKQILITHYHPDHLGGAGWLQEWCGAPVYLHDLEVEQVERFWGASVAEQVPRLVAFFTAEGMPAEMAAAIGEHHLRQLALVRPLPSLTPVAAGTTMRLGRGEYEVIHAPGHSDGLAVFFDRSTGILLANDMILAKITPNISLWPGCRPNPLADYLASLEKVEALGARIALPGHRSVIADVRGRVAEIRAHHRERLAKVDAVTRRYANGATAWEVTEAIFRPAELTLHQIRFAMAEALAHLAYLVEEGQMVKEGNRYRAVG